MGSKTRQSLAANLRPPKNHKSRRSAVPRSQPGASRAWPSTLMCPSSQPALQIGDRFVSVVKRGRVGPLRTKPPSAAALSGCRTPGLVRAAASRLRRTRPLRGALEECGRYGQQRSWSLGVAALPTVARDLSVTELQPLLLAATGNSTAWVGTGSQADVVNWLPAPRPGDAPTGQPGTARLDPKDARSGRAADQIAGPTPAHAALT
jgi:hypothetical protein